MNKRVIRILTDCLIAMILVIVWRMTGLEQLGVQKGFVFSLITLPLIWLGLRHGGSAAVVVAFLAGAVNALIFIQGLTVVQRILIEIVPLLVVGISGFFAKYTQKTLNNRRLSSMRLNIFTASILVTFGYYALRYVLLPVSSIIDEQPLWTSINFWAGWIASALIMGILLSIMAQLKPEWLIPKRSRYLSRKETSRLLND